MIDVEVALAVVAVVGALGDVITNWMSQLRALTGPVAQIAIVIAGLLGIFTVMNGGSLKKVGVTILGILAVVAMISAAPGAVSEADQIGNQIGQTVNSEAGQ